MEKENPDADHDTIHAMVGAKLKEMKEERDQILKKGMNCILTLTSSL
jgi:hypothetical protein